MHRMFPVHFVGFLCKLTIMISEAKGHAIHRFFRIWQNKWSYFWLLAVYISIIQIYNVLSHEEYVTKEKRIRF